MLGRNRFGVKDAINLEKKRPDMGDNSLEYCLRGPASVLIFQDGDS